MLPGAAAAIRLGNLSPFEVLLAEGEKTDTEIRIDKAEWVIDRLGDADRFFCMGARLGERSLLGQAPN